MTIFGGFKWEEYHNSFSTIKPKDYSFKTNHRVESKLWDCLNKKFESSFMNIRAIATDLD